MKRAKSTQLKPIIDDLLNGTHASFDVTETSSLTRAVVEKQLQSTCGAHQPSHYDFDGVNGEDAHTNKEGPRAASEPAQPPPPEENSPKSPAPVAQPPQEATPKKEAAPAEQAPVIAANIGDAWAAVQSSTSPINWVALTYDGRNVATAKLIGMGDDGLAGLKEILDDELIVFCGLRVTAIDDRGSVKSIRAKFVFIQFIGTGVKPMVRANAGPMKSHFEAILSGCHMSISTSSTNELTPETLEQRLQSTCGAHRPNRYEFGKKIVEVGDC
jgi:hypothetical protein